MTLPDEDDSNALPPGTAMGEFDIVRVIGEGGFGIVYLAFDRSLGRHVALKEYMPSSLARRVGQTTVRVKSERLRETFDAGLRSFINEARLLAQFDHPSLVKVYRFWEAGGTAYMVMPFYEGSTLKQTLAQRQAQGQEPPGEAWLLKLLAPLIDALAVLHAEHCYHRDVAPDNIILLASSGAPLLLDFGAARRVIGNKTQALTVVLKSGYAPIEQYAEVPALKQGPWTDIYALGAVVYFAITGHTPPPAVSRWVEDGCERLSSVAAGRCGAGFLAAIDRALAVRPEDRPQSLAELRQDLGLVRGDDDATVLIAPVAPLAPQPIDPDATVIRTSHAMPASTAFNASSPKPPKRSIAPVAAIGAVALLVAGAAIYLWSRSTAPSPPAPVVSAPAASASAAAAPPVAAPSAPPAIETPPGPRAPFDRVVAAQSPGFEVSLRPTRTTLRVDRDRLAFSVQATHGGYLHLLLMAPDGSVTQIIPNQRIKSVRLQPGQTLAIPQGSWGMSLMASDPPGEEQVLAIVSREPRDFSRLGGALEGAYLVIPASAAATAPAAGSPPPLAGLPQCSGSSGCAADYGAAVFSVNVVR